MNPQFVLAVAVGGAIGSVARYLVGIGSGKLFGINFPWGTLIINITGSFLIGVLMTLLTERWRPHPNWRLFLVVGVLGGYTTFSSFEYETYQAVREGARWIGLVYVTGSVAVGYFGVWLGAILAGSR